VGQDGYRDGDAEAGPEHQVARAPACVCPVEASDPRPRNQDLGHPKEIDWKNNAGRERFPARILFVGRSGDIENLIVDESELNALRLQEVRNPDEARADTPEEGRPVGMRVVVQGHQVVHQHPDDLG